MDMSTNTQQASHNLCTLANALPNAFPKAFLSQEYYVDDRAIKMFHHCGGVRRAAEGY